MTCGNNEFRSFYFFSFSIFILNNKRIYFFVFCVYINQLSIEMNFAAKVVLLSLLLLQLCWAICWCQCADAHLLKFHLLPRGKLKHVQYFLNASSFSRTRVKLAITIRSCPAFSKTII
jgi:hypothetical protein